MDSATRLKRHSQLWEASTTNVRRAAISGVIFAVVILFNVIEPHYKIEAEKPLLEQWQSDLATLEEEQAELEIRIQNLASIGKTLETIDDTLSRAPWMSEIDDLIDYCAGNCPSGAKAEAKKTVENIANAMRTQILDVFRKTISETKMEDDFAIHAVNIEVAIKNWESKRIRDDSWWRTQQSKRESTEGVGNAVRLTSSTAGTVVSELNDKAVKEIEGIRSGLKDKKKVLGSKKIEVDEEITEKKEKIEQALNAALPGWATGLFTVNRMIALYPWILVTIAMYLVGSGLYSGHHFRGMADAAGWSAKERGDPLLSSPWTLTWRSYSGLAVTLLYFGAVLGTLAYCLYRSIEAATKPVAPELDLAVPPTFLAFAFLVLALLIVVIAPLRRRAD